MSVLAEISDWRLEERGLRHNKYFYCFSNVNEVVAGKKCFVIGRKGAGKTAIAEHIRQSVDAETFVTKLSFRSFPLNMFYRLKDVNFSPESQYISIWKFLIYSSICRMMSENQRLHGREVDELRNIFKLDIESALSDWIEQLSRPSVSLQLLGVGGSYNQKSESRENVLPLSERCKILERMINNNIDGCSYYVLFDELDEDFNDPEDINYDSQYINLITNLFKAIAEIRSSLQAHSVFPVLFLRDDIFDRIQYSDRGKWRDDMVQLSWNKDSLRRLIAHRIARTLEEKAPESSSDDIAWDEMFDAQEVSHGRGKRQRRSVFDHMIRQTYMRPRDAIVYIRECAKLLAARHLTKITRELIHEADAEYSQYLKTEIEDEIHSVLPECRHVLNTLSWFGKQNFKHDEFKAFYLEQAERVSGQLPSFEKRSRYFIRIQCDWASNEHAADVQIPVAEYSAASTKCKGYDMHTSWTVRCSRYSRLKHFHHIHRRRDSLGIPSLQVSRQPWSRLTAHL